MWPTFYDIVTGFLCWIFISHGRRLTSAATSFIDVATSLASQTLRRRLAGREFDPPNCMAVSHSKTGRPLWTNVRSTNKVVEFIWHNESLFWLCLKLMHLRQTFVLLPSWFLDVLCPVLSKHAHGNRILRQGSQVVVAQFRSKIWKRILLRNPTHSFMIHQHTGLFPVPAARWVRLIMRRIAPPNLCTWLFCPSFTRTQKCPRPDFPNSWRESMQTRLPTRANVS